MVNTKTGDGKAVILPSKAATEKYGKMVVVQFIKEQGLADGAGVFLQ